MHPDLNRLRQQLQQQPGQRPHGETRGSGCCFLVVCKAIIAGLFIGLIVVVCFRTITSCLNNTQTKKPAARPGDSAVVVQRQRPRTSSEATPISPPAPAIPPPPPAIPASTPPPVRPARTIFRVVNVAAGDSLNLRQAPSGSARILDTLPPHTIGISPTGRRARNGADVWVEVKIRGLVGWVHEDYIAPDQIYDQ